MLPRQSWRVLVILAGLAVCVPNRVGAATAAGPLVTAVKQGDVKAVQGLLGKGADINAAEVDGTTALHWAANRDQVEMVDQLLRAGANARAANRYGITPLWLASVNGHAAIVERLLIAGADPNATRLNTGETPLMIAARAGHADVARLLLTRGANVNATETVRSQTALMWAAAEKHPAVVKVLLEAGANVKALSKTKLSPLMFAIRAGNVDSTGVLLDAGASVTERTADGITMLVLAMINARYDVAALLLDRGADANGDDLHGRPLHVLTLMRRADNRGLAEVLPRMPSGNLDSIGFATALLAHGANINWQERDGLPGYAYGREKARIAIALPGFNLVGATAFLLAAANCDVPFMKFLAAHGADPLLSTKDKITPLMAAAGIGFRTGERPGTNEEALEAVKLAADLGNDPKAVIGSGAEGGGAGRPAGLGGRGVDGQTSLHGAVTREAPEIVRWLIEKGVPLAQKGKDGKTALDATQDQFLGTTLQIRQEIAAIIRQKMVEQGIPIPPPSDAATRPAAGR